MVVAACPAAEGSARGCQWDSQGTGSCRQDGGLGCPGGAQLHALQAGATACHGSKLMPPFPSLPTSHPRLAPPRWPLGRGPGGRTRWCRDAGAHHLLPAPAGGEEDGASSLTPFSCLPVGGPGLGKRGNVFLKTTDICKANQVESLKSLEILFFFKKKGN